MGMPIDYFVCDYSKGIEKRVCRHSVLAMVKEEMLTFPHGVKNRIVSEEPLKGLRKCGRPRASDVGRPPKVSKQSRFTE